MIHVKEINIRKENCVVMPKKGEIKQTKAEYTIVKDFSKKIKGE